LTAFSHHRWHPRAKSQTVTTGSLQFANSLQALNSFLDKLSGVQTRGGFAFAFAETKPARNFQMRGELNFQTHWKLLVRPSLFT
jgi:hypothetical protein